MWIGIDIFAAVLVFQSGQHSVSVDTDTVPFFGDVSVEMELDFEQRP